MGPIQFTVVFSENVTGFTNSDIDLSASSIGGLSATVVQNTPSNYTVSVTGMSGNGTVVAKVIAGAATDAVGNTSVASTSTDNTVTFAPVAGPSVTINKAAGQADPTNGASITFDAVFSEGVTGFTGADVDLSGSSLGGLSASVSQITPSVYTVTVTGMTGTGTVMATIPAGVATSISGSVPTQASTSTDNQVSFDRAAPTVTINQSAGQADPTSITSISFDVSFNEPVTGFNASDVSVTGTAGGTLSVNVTGSLNSYVVTVTGMTVAGSVIASIAAGAASDAVGNASVASTSTDNTVQFITNGTIGFTQAVYNVTEDTPSITVFVTRTGMTGGPVSIDYAVTDGTAHSGGPSLTGQADYTPVIAGTFHWADGDDDPKPIVIPILPDELNEGKELIKLTLTNPDGGPSLGITSAVVAIEPSDGDGPGVYRDHDNDKVTIRLLNKGKTGSLLFFRTDDDGDGQGPIELIELSGTLPNPLMPMASLVIGVVKSATSSDGGTVGLGAVTGSGLASILARKANLNLEGILLDGYVRAVTIGNILNGADINTQATTNPLQKTRINALTIADDTTIEVDATIGNLTAVRMGVGEVIAPRILTMLVRGQPSFGVVGDMNSDITLSGTSRDAGKLALGTFTVAGSIPAEVDITAPRIGTMIVRGNMAGDVNVTGVGVDPAKKALIALRVRGAVTGSELMVNGSVGLVRVGAFRDSNLYAGYTGALDGSGTFNKPAVVSTFVSTSLFDGFQNSRVIANRFGTVTIANVDETNINDEFFGFYAHQSLGTINVMSPTRWHYIPTLPTPQFVGEFEVKIV